MLKAPFPSSSLISKLLWKPPLTKADAIVAHHKYRVSIRRHSRSITELAKHQRRKCSEQHVRDKVLFKRSGSSSLKKRPLSRKATDSESSTQTHPASCRAASTAAQSNITVKRLRRYGRSACRKRAPARHRYPASQLKASLASGWKLCSAFFTNSRNGESSWPVAARPCSAYRLMAVVT